MMSARPLLYANPNPSSALTLCLPQLRTVSLAPLKLGYGDFLQPTFLISLILVCLIIFSDFCSGEWPSPHGYPWHWPSGALWALH